MTRKKALKMLGIIITVYVAMRYMLPLIIPFLFAWFCAKGLQRGAKWMERKLRWKRKVAGVFLFLCAFGILAVVLCYLGRGIYGQLELMISRADLARQRIEAFVNESSRVIEEVSGISRKACLVYITQAIESAAKEISGKIPGLLWNFGRGLVQKSTVFFSAFLVFLVSVFLFFKDMDSYMRSLKRYEIWKKCNLVLGRLKVIGGAYARAQLILMVLIGGICAAGFFMLGSPYYLVAGVGLGVFDAFPLLGTGLILVPWGVICMIRGAIWQGVGYLILYLITNLLREYLEPKLIGARLGIPPILILMSVYIGFFVYGTWGFLLGPISAILIYTIYITT